MKRLLLPGGLALLLLLCLAGFFVTRNESSFEVRRTKAPNYSIDDSLLTSARTLAATAEGTGEQELAAESLRISDHEVDQEFATELRAAAAPSSRMTPDQTKISDQIAKLKAKLAAGQLEIGQLTKKAATDEDAAAQLEVAKAQNALDQDELEDLREDLAKVGGDKRADIERLLKAHEASDHQGATAQKSKTHTTTDTLGEQVQAWLDLRNRGTALQQAEQHARDHGAKLERLHKSLEDSLGAGKASAIAGGDDDETNAIVAKLKGLSDQRRTLSEFDKRIQDSQQLARTYRSWGGLVEAKQRAVGHLLLGSMAIVLAILFVLALVEIAIRRGFTSKSDRRRRVQLQVMATVAARFVAILLILFVIFGPPSQLSTIIGLATAGITVVLKDFIVAFLGWFVLMGKNGIHVGDWVEIEGVGGEVIEIGLLRTVLLEVGNWTDRGHPTGRRVAFINKFAVEGHYFNFSTSDQWLWDELVVSLPHVGDPYQLCQRILETVQKATESDAALAEQDWQRVTHQYGAKSFSARPASDIRPSANGSGLDVRVRYITRAPQRYQVKSMLFESVVDLLHKATLPTAQ